ncbi:hypothetical protein [Pseudolysinimonas sp.]|uniref:hypothetical protein n=1 Tax=Pseudolysinimonas sp. TaxID=2680009 RepID=UPI003F7E7E8D
MPAAITIAALSACAAQSDPSEARHSSIRTVPSTPAEPSLPKPPASQTPGPCEELVPASSVQRLIGDVALDADAGIDRPLGLLAEEAQSGFSSCGWGDALTLHPHEAGFELTFQRHAAVVVAQLPGGGIDYDGGVPAGIGADASSSVCTTGSGTDTCNIRFQVGDYLVGVWAQRPDSAGGLTAFTMGVQEVLRALVSRLRSTTTPPAWQRPAPSWPAETDCARIGDRGAVAAAAGWTDLKAGDQYNSPQDLSLGGALECLWLPSESHEDGTRPELAVADYVQGGAWIWSTFAGQKGFTPETVPGADHAGMICDGSPGGCQVAAVIGGNVVSVVQSSDMGIGNGSGLGQQLLLILAAALRGVV